ncbi:MAG: hypothetical protein GX368_03145 [Erysipelotrichaceae bacterium]|nr:hypothetical protein [Erysipelotrichaceae bacterium]
MINIDIFATSDIHGEEGYYNSLSLIREKYPFSIIVDNGDYFIGSIRSTYFNNEFIFNDKKNLLIEYANDNFDVMNLGNHDVDYGIDILKKYTKNLTMSYLCANILDENNNAVFKPYKIIENQGVKICFLGIVTSNLSQLTDFDNLRNFKVLTVFEALDLYLNEVKEKSDLVIVLYHGGFEKDPITGNVTQYDTKEDEGYKIMENYPNIDGLILGHQHRDSCGNFKNTGLVFVQPNCRAISIGHLSFQIEKSSKTIIEASASLINLDAKYNVKEDENFNLWLNKSITMDYFEDYLKESFVFDCIFIKGQVKSIKDLMSIFKKPYMLSTYYMKKEELKDMLLDVKEDKKHYLLISNDINLPYYRIKERHINNIIDGYIHCLYKNKLINF